MDLKQRIGEDIKAAMKARESARLSALRLLSAAIKQKEVDERIALDDAGVLAVVEKLIKQRKDALAQYEAAGRADLAAAERFEIEVLSAYLPQPLSPHEIEALIADTLAEVGAQGLADMGKAMAALKPKLAGRADMAVVSQMVKASLTSR
ncbi:MAG: GatB/YqeY domain-containing protein [Rhodocyclaceae bacterium]|nr:GatB/YqeY domain-containing protein [Rhodocyclaceae bacterium]